jgi:hypothetical protein
MFMNQTIPGYHVYLPYEQFFDDVKPSREALLDLVRRLPRGRTMGALVATTAILTNQRDGLEAGPQHAFAHEMASEVPWATVLLDALRATPNAVIITEEHLAMLFRLVLEHGPQDRGDVGPDYYDAMLRALLMLNTLDASEAEANGANNTFVRTELRSLTYDTENPADVIERYARFLEWSRSPAALNSDNYLNLDEDMLRFFGMSYDEYAAAIFAFWSYYASIASSKELAARKPFVDYAATIASMTDHSVLDRFLARFSTDLERLLADFQKEHETLSGAGLRPLLQTPLVRCPAGIIAPYPRHLRNLLGTGLFFALMDSYRDAAGPDPKARKDAVDRFTRFFGEFFEDYVVQRFDETYRTANAKLYTEREYQPGVKSTDLVIIEDETAIFIEVVAKRFNYMTSIQKLDPKAITRDIDSMVVEKVEQLDRNVRDFREGVLIYPGVDAAAITRIYPIVATVQPIPQNVGITTVIAASVAEKGYLADTEPLQFLAAEEIEMLGPAFASGYSLESLLSKKTADSFWRTQSVRNFVVTSMRSLLEYASPPSPRYQRVLSVVSSWGMGS